jgi:hypothetical protein
VAVVAAGGVAGGGVVCGTAEAVVRGVAGVAAGEDVADDGAAGDGVVADGGVTAGDGAGVITGAGVRGTAFCGICSSTTM